MNGLVLYVTRAALDLLEATFSDLANSLTNAFCLSKLSLPTVVDASRIKTTSVVILYIDDSKEIKYTISFKVAPTV